jgi:putative ABC transport system permease protein
MEAWIQSARTLVLIAVRNLLQNKKRTLLLGTAVAMVTVLLVLLSSLLNGMQDTMLRNATTLSSGHVNVAGFFKITSGTAAPVVTHYAELEAAVRKHVTGLDLIVERGRGWGKVISETTSLQSAIAGIDIDRERGFMEAVTLESGDLKQLHEPHTVMIFHSQAEKLGVKVGDEVTISSPTFRGVSNTVELKIVAVAKDMGMLSSFSVFVHHDAIRDLYLLDESTTGALHVYLKDPDRSEEVASKLQTALQKDGYRLMERVAEPFWRKFDTVKREDWTGQKIDITTWIDEMKFMRFTLDAVKWIRNILVAVLLVIIVIGVMNTLWISIRERTREIGTLRAIGMQRLSIMAMFMTEAAILALVATTVGVLLGALTATLLTHAHLVAPKMFQLFLMTETWRLVVDRAIALWSLGIIALLTTVGALYPSYRATRLQPVTAMHAN